MKINSITAEGVVMINDNNHVLIAKRKADKPMPLKWEFPGGKLEKNESLEACGIREIKEELELDIVIRQYLGVEEIHYNNKDFSLHLYTAEIKDKTQKLVLNEHDEVAWVGLEDFARYDFPASKLSFIKTLKSVLDKRV